MKTHCSDTISELEDEVQRLKSEKARLLDRLQLPESERASLAAEENEIAELKRRLDDYEIRYGDAVAENEDLQQEVPIHPGAVLGKNIWGPGPLSFGRQQRAKLLCPIIQY